MPVVGASTAIITIRAVDMTTSVMNGMSRGFSANAARLQSQIVASNAAITRSAQNTARANEVLQNQAARRVATLAKEQVRIPAQIDAERLRVTKMVGVEAARINALKLQDAAAQQIAARNLLKLEAQRADLSQKIGQRGIGLLPQRNYVDQTIIAAKAAEATRAASNLTARTAIKTGIEAQATATLAHINDLKARGVTLTNDMAMAERNALSAINANNLAHANRASLLRDNVAQLGQQLKAQLNLAAVAKVAETGRNIGRVGAQIGLGLTAVTTLPMVMAIGASTTAAMDFNKEMLNIQSIGKQTDDVIGALGTGFLKLSADITKTTATPKDLANAYYEIQSSGFYGADASKILEQSTKAATAGLADTRSTAMAAARSLNAYGDSANNVGQYLDIMVRGVDIGVYRMQDFNEQMGDFIAAAGMLGVPFEEVTAALTTMTKKGLGLDEAATSLNRIMMEYLKPSPIAKANAAEFGIELSSAAIKANGFAAALQEVYDKTGGSEDALAGIFREMRAARGIFAIAGDGLKTYNEDLAKLRNASGSVDSIFAVQMKSWAAQVQSFKNSLSVLGISIGSEVLPVLTRMINTDLKPFFANIASVAPGIFKGFVEGFSGFTASLSTISPEQMRSVGELFGNLAKVGPGLMVGGIAVQGLSAVLGLLVKIADFFTKFPGVAAFLGVSGAGIATAVGGTVVAGIYTADQLNKSDEYTKTLERIQQLEQEIFSGQRDKTLTTTDEITKAKELAALYGQVAKYEISRSNVGPLAGKLDLAPMTAEALRSSDAYRLQAQGLQELSGSMNSFLLTATPAEALMQRMAATSGMLPDTALGAASAVTSLAMAAGALLNNGRGVPDMLDSISQAAGNAAKNVAAAALSLGALQATTGKWTTNQYGEPELIPYDAAAIQAGQDQNRTDKADALVLALEKIMTDNSAAGKKALDDAQAASQKRLTDATSQLESVFKGLFQTAQDVSKALSDLTGAGGAGAAADPEGFMKDIRRLQAWIKDGSWGEEAAEHGYKTKEEAAADIGAMQRGDWSKVLAPEHNKLVDITKIQSAGMAQLGNDNFMQSNIDALVKQGLPTALAQQFAGPGGALPGAPTLPGQTPLLPGQANALPGAAKPAQAAQTIIQAGGGGGISMGVDMGKLSKDMATDADKNQSAFAESGGKVFGYWQEGFFAAADTSNLMVSLVNRLVLNAMSGLVPAGVQ